MCGFVCVRVVVFGDFGVRGWGKNIWPRSRTCGGERSQGCGVLGFGGLGWKPLAEVENARDASVANVAQPLARMVGDPKLATPCEGSRGYETRNPETPNPDPETMKV